MVAQREKKETAMQKMKLDAALHDVASHRLRKGKNAPMPATPVGAAVAYDSATPTVATLQPSHLAAARRARADLEGLMSHMMKALRPFLHSYGAADQYGDGADAVKCARVWSTSGPGYTSGCALLNGKQCPTFPSLALAKAECAKMAPRCGSIVKSGGAESFDLRLGGERFPSASGETSWLLTSPCVKTPTSLGVWETFQSAVVEARANPALGLTHNEGVDMEPVRADDSVFLSVASYRDASCPKTVRTAFEGATNPLLLNVGVVQQNCHRDCKRGTGWGSTRRIVPQPQPDVDCIEAFCASALGHIHCLAGRVRILRLNESGPFFISFFCLLYPFVCSLFFCVLAILRVQSRLVPSSRATSPRSCGRGRRTSCRWTRTPTSAKAGTRRWSP